MTMKKILILLSVLFLFSLPLFAVQDCLKQYDTTSWLMLEKAVKSNLEKEIVESTYTSFITSDVSAFEKARAEYLYSRYLMDRGEKEEAKKHLKEEEKYMNMMEGESDLLLTMARIDYTSAKTYINRDLSSGLENSNLTKEAIKKYPDEAYIIITNAWRLIYTPQIAGGSNKNAIKNLEPLLSSIDSLSISNQYSCYGALATAHYNRKDYKEGMDYLSRAFDIYYGEPPLLELKENLEKKIK